VLRIAAERIRAGSAFVELFGAKDLALPMYAPEATSRTARAEQMVSAMRRAHGFLIASPGYHGAMSGLVKNALDYAEDLREDTPPYWEGRAVGLIACAAGWQAAGNTMLAMRAIVHALRGWPTPLGIALNTCSNPFSEQGKLADLTLERQLTILVEQVLSFATMRMIAKSASWNLSSGVKGHG